MLNKLRNITLVALIVMLFTQCNEEDTGTNVMQLGYGDVAVLSFKLMRNDSVCENLDSVYFVVDLDNSRIYNPDSLPMGTKINNIVIEPTYGDVEKAEVTFRQDNGVDTTFTYTGNASDTINFVNGPVYLTLTSLDKVATRSYLIEINVHKSNPDTYAWTEFAEREMADYFPGDDIDKWGAVERGDTIFTLFKLKNGQNRLLVGYGNGLSSWDDIDLTLPSGADPSTLTATPTAFYMLFNGKLMKSTDRLNDWSDCSMSMTHIYGAQGEKLLGVDLKNGKYYHVTYPQSIVTEVAPGCPVAQTSQLFTYDSKWSDTPMSMFTGGRTASGDYNSASWAFDGEQWQSISLQAMPQRKGFMVVPYFAFKTSTNWIVDERTVLFAFGGLTLDNVADTTSYISYDRGVHWQLAPSNMEIPQKVGALVDSRAFVLNTLMDDESRSAAAWMPVALPPLPRWASVASAPATSRAQKPITEWESPYIYIFDGQNARIWRGIINRLTYKPLQ